MYIDVTADGQAHNYYHLCIGFVTPRPIALVSTVDEKGNPNLAPFSWYNMVSGTPPVVMFVVGSRPDQQKDTLQNVRATGEFVVATVTESIVEECVRCGASLAADESEFDFSGLTPTPATKVKPALVQESVANIECKVRDIITISQEPGGGNIVLGDVTAIHIADWVIGDDGLVDQSKLRTIGRLGGSSYSTVKDTFELSIPKV